MSKKMKGSEKLQQAIDNNDLAAVKLILKAEGNAAKDICLCELLSGGNALHYAASHGHVDIMAAILNAGVDVNSRRTQGDGLKGLTALHEAVDESQKEAMGFLLQKGANVNIKDDNGLTPLHIACRQNSLELVEELFKAGADVNSKDNRENTPLLVCIMRSANESALFLLNNGADVQINDKDGQSPLHYASEWECLELVKVLVAHGAHVNQQDSEGNTPLHVTLDEDVFDFLVEHGSDPTLRNKKGRAARDQRIDVNKEEFANINKALGTHAEKMGNRPSHSARLQQQQAPPSRIFSPGPPIPETELRSARSNMLKQLQQRTGFQGAAITLPKPEDLKGNSVTTPRTPRSSGTPLVSPLAREADKNLSSQFSKTTISSSK